MSPESPGNPEPPVAVARVRDGRPASGTAVLVDRLWPRGQRKDDAPWDEWLKDVAPSTGLRTWYGHDPERHEEFVRRYRAELRDGDRAAALDRLRTARDDAGRGGLTLLTATKDLGLSHAQVLADLLRNG